MCTGTFFPHLQWVCRHIHQSWGMWANISELVFMCEDGTHCVWVFTATCMCVCVCVCVREREHTAQLSLCVGSASPAWGRWTRASCGGACLCGAAVLRCSPARRWHPARPGPDSGSGGSWTSSPTVCGSLEMGPPSIEGAHIATPAEGITQGTRMMRHGGVIDCVLVDPAV